VQHAPPVAGRPPAAPVTPAERLPLLDLLRGVAIAGIVFVNLKFFATPLFSVLEYRLVDDFPGVAHRAADWVVMALAEGKFYPLLALLFGYGFGIQLERAGEPGGRYLRRLAGLLALGLAHAFLVWAGDVLVTYAVVGALLALFRRRSDRALLAWAGLLYGVHLLVLGLSGLVVAEGGRDTAAAAAVRSTYAEGSFGQVLAQRAADAAITLPSSVVGGAPGFLAMMLLGLWAQRRGVFRRPGEHATLLRRTALVGLALGGGCSIAYATLWWFSDGRGALAGLAFVVGGGGFLQALGYAAAVTLLVERGRTRLLEPLRPVGRLALSSYLLQSLLATLVFYGYGLGLYGRVGPAPGLAVALGIVAACVLLSAVWLRVFRIGPAEWLLRSLTYARLQPLR
jgi:uncharacterized protein